MQMHRKSIGVKAALAALAFIYPCRTLALQPEPAPERATTIPALPDEEGAFRRASEAFDRNEAETPLLLKGFLNDFKASGYYDRATLMLADWYFYNGDYHLAYGYYSGIRDNAFSGTVRDGMLYRKAFSMMKAGYYDEAALLFRQLAGNAEYGESARFYLAYIDYVRGDYDKAYEEFQKISSSGAKGNEAEYYLNQIEYQRGNYRKVATTSERLLSVPIPDEMLAETMRVGGLSYFKLGDRTSAGNLLRRYADRTGDGAELAALYALATIYYDEGNYSKALPLFTTITEYPGDLAQSSWLYIGQIYIAQGDAQAAALAFDKASRESWDGTVAETAAFNLAVNSTAGMALPFSDAVKAMEKFIDTYPSSPYASSLSSYLANAYYGQRDYENALRQVEKISGKNPAAAEMKQKILYQKGITEFQQGKLTEAISSLKEAASTRMPDREVAAQASLWLGDAYYLKKDYRNAVAAYESALSGNGAGNNRALAYYNLGYAYMKQKNYAKAENAFREATRLNGLDSGQLADALMRYGDTLYYNGKYSDALSLFRSLKSQPDADQTYAMIRESDILGREGKLKEKISILETLKNGNDTGIWHDTVISRLADAYSETGDDRRATEMYSLIIDSSASGTDNSQAYYAIAANADNLFKAGDMEGALIAYRKMEQSGIPNLYPSALAGIMRTSTNDTEIADYAARVASLPGISADERNEAIFTGAEAGVRIGGQQLAEAKKALDELARSADRDWGAKAAVALGEQLLKEGDATGAEEILLYLVDNGSDDNYWLARGYIALADAYSAQDKDYLARLYLENLQTNYPGKEKDIKDMINKRLKSLSK